MAIEWNLFDAAPVGRLKITRAASKVSDRLLGVGVLNFDTALTADDFVVDNSGPVSSQLYVTGECFSALVDLIAEPMINDDGSLAEDGLYFATVVARRTMASVALGLSVAIGWLEISHGELTGPGLQGCYRAGMVRSLMEEYSAPEEIGGRMAIEWVANRILGRGAIVPFAG